MRARERGRKKKAKTPFTLRNGRLSRGCPHTDMRGESPTLVFIYSIHLIYLQFQYYYYYFYYHLHCNQLSYPRYLPAALQRDQCLARSAHEKRPFANQTGNRLWYGISPFLLVLGPAPITRASQQRKEKKKRGKSPE
jgi:hypothetical protein